MLLFPFHRWAHEVQGGKEMFTGRTGNPKSPYAVGLRGKVENIGEERRDPGKLEIN